MTSAQVQTGDHEGEMQLSELGPLFCDSWGKHRIRIPPCTAFGRPMSRWILVHVSAGRACRANRFLWEERVPRRLLLGVSMRRYFAELMVEPLGSGLVGGELTRSARRLTREWKVLRGRHLGI